MLIGPSLSPRQKGLDAAIAGHMAAGVRPRAARKRDYPRRDMSEQQQEVTVAPGGGGGSSQDSFWKLQQDANVPNDPERANMFSAVGLVKNHSKPSATLERPLLAGCRPG